MCWERRRSRSAGQSASRARRRRRVGARARARPRSAIRLRRGEAPRDVRPRACRRVQRTRRGRGRARAQGRRPAAPRLPGVVLRERLSGFGDRALEQGKVEFVVAHLEQVARRACVQPRLRKRLPQLRHVDLHHLLCRVRHVLAPERVDELLAGDRAVGVQEQDREERPLFARRDGNRHAIAQDLLAGRGGESPSGEDVTLPPARPSSSSREVWRSARAPSCRSSDALEWIAGGCRSPSRPGRNR